LVGGTGVSVGLGTKVLVGVREGVLEGIRDAVSVIVALGSLSFVRVGGTGVQVTKGLVGVMYVIAVRVGEIVSVNVGVGVGINSAISTAVMAAIVLIGLEKAESTISPAPISETGDVLGLARAAAETMQIRLNPSTPAARTVSGPEYSRILTLVSLYLRHIKTGCSFLP
jgi:hypothetical protein